MTIFFCKAICATMPPRPFGLDTAWDAKPAFWGSEKQTYLYSQKENRLEMLSPTQRQIA